MRTGVGDKVARTDVVAVNLTNLNGEKILSISAGSDVSFVLTKSGNLYGWGTNSYGQLLNGKNTGLTTIPTRSNTTVFDNDPIAKISSGVSFVSVLTKSGKIYGWGLNSNGQVSESIVCLRFIVITHPELGWY